MFLKHTGDKTTVHLDPNILNKSLSSAFTPLYLEHQLAVTAKQMLDASMFKRIKEQIGFIKSYIFYNA